MKKYKDSEEIKRQLRIWVQECEDWLEHKEASCFRDCIDLLDEIPAADVVEVRHGRWDDSGRYKFPNGETAVCCTECGCALRKKEYENNNWFYCPVCGAIMDKEE